MLINAAHNYFLGDILLHLHKSEAVLLIFHGLERSNAIANYYDRVFGGRSVDSCSICNNWSTSSNCHLCSSLWRSSLLPMEKKE